MTERTIKLDYLARVEGEGALDIRISGNQIDHVKLRIFEPPRFFEALLRGRDFTEAPDITSRICGICPVAYLMSSAHAMEDACEVAVNGPIRALRRLLYCGEWIESHVLHIGMLHLPDFLGLPDAIHLAKQNRPLVQDVLRLKSIGNRLLTVLGGREIHPINVKVGGFYRAPAPADLHALVPELAWGLDASQRLLEFLATLDFPDFEQDYQFVSLRHSDEYPFNEGRIVSNTDIDIDVAQFDQVFIESQVEHSTALHATTLDGQPCHVGPLARFANNADLLSPLASKAAGRAGLHGPCHNPFKSILVRAVEVIFCFEEAIRLIEAYQPIDPIALKVKPSTASIGHGCTEAPRGICYHRYAIEADGTISDARITPPTCINQPMIESDLYHVIADNLALGDDELRERCEQAVRNYDPCISCATHFLKLTVDRQ